MSAHTDRKRKNNEKYNQKINCNRNVRCAYRRFHETLVRVIQESPYADRVVTLDNPTFEGRKTQAIQAIRQATGFTPRTGIS